MHRYLTRIGRASAPDELLKGSVDDETFVNFLAQHLDVPPLEKQALLEAPTLDERASRLLDAIVFRLEELRTGLAGPPRAH
jgi:Lon protease-like protein